jgi:hypothetical protein
VAVLRVVVATGIATIVAAVWAGIPGSELMIAPILIAIVVILAPDRGEVFRFGAPQPFLLAVAVIVAVPATLEAGRQADLQGGMTSGDEHHAMLHYAGMTTAYLALVLAAAWSAFPGRAVRTARVLVGVAGLVLGIGFIAYPHAVSSLGAAWGGGIVAVSILYVVLAVLAGGTAMAATDATSEATT